MERRAAMAEQLINGQVIEACQQGDRDAFQCLFEAYKDKVFSIAVYSSGGDRTLAEDITQQIFLKLFTAIRQFRGDSEFTTWLYRLVVNACIDERRRRKRLKLSPARTRPRLIGTASAARHVPASSTVPPTCSRKTVPC